MAGEHEHWYPGSGGLCADVKAFDVARVMQMRHLAAFMFWHDLQDKQHLSSYAQQALGTQGWPQNVIRLVLCQADSLKLRVQHSQQQAPCIGLLNAKLYNCDLHTSSTYCPATIFTSSAQSPAACGGCPILHS